MSDGNARCVGVATLVVAAVVVISGFACMIWSRTGMGNIEIFTPSDLSMINKCLIQAGQSEPDPYYCGDTTDFSCDESGAIIAGYTICGLPPPCLCLLNATDNNYVQMAHATSVADLIKILLNIASWLNFGAGLSAVIAVIPVLIGAAGKVAGNDNLANACGTTGIVFEICCGFLTTWSLAGAALGITEIGPVFGLAIWENSNADPYAPLVQNTCPESCQEATSSIRHEWMEFSTLMRTASGLAVFAGVISIIALIFTCIGFCVQRRIRRVAYYRQQQNVNTTVAVTQPLNTGPVAVYQTTNQTAFAAPMAFSEAKPYPTPVVATMQPALPTATYSKQ